jgi:hypothetical protein
MLPRKKDGAVMSSPERRAFMRHLRSLMLGALLGLLALGGLAATPQKASAYVYFYGPYGAYYSPYYGNWSPYLWRGGYYVNPYGYGAYYGAYNPYVNQYYYWYRNYPWWY